MDGQRAVKSWLRGEDREPGGMELSSHRTATGSAHPQNSVYTSAGGKGTEEGTMTVLKDKDWDKLTVMTPRQ